MSGRMSALNMGWALGLYYFTVKNLRSDEENAQVFFVIFMETKSRRKVLEECWKGKHFVVVGFIRAALKCCFSSCTTGVRGKEDGNILKLSLEWNMVPVYSHHLHLDTRWWWSILKLISSKVRRPLLQAEEQYKILNNIIRYTLPFLSFCIPGTRKDKQGGVL